MASAGQEERIEEDDKMAQRVSQNVVAATSGATEIDCTGYANVRVHVSGDNCRIAFDAVSLDSQYFLVNNQGQPPGGILSLDNVNATLFLRAAGAGPSCTVYLLMWN